MSLTPLTSQRLASKVAIVTGASSGLGRAIALEFAANGAGLVVCADLQPTARGDWGISEAGVPTHELICKRYGEGRALYVKADVTVAEEVESLVEQAVKVGGRLDMSVRFPML
jgi:NAD(P)-dependent dehydrogenase (short-subunit alcohol dehydrogenase family)